MFKRRFSLVLRTFKGDIDIFYEIFWKNTYEIPSQYMENEPEIIVDLGAHIGLTSIYFALRYPNAKIYSLEASSENYELLKQNTSSFKNITCLHNAIYFENKMINFGNNGLMYNQNISENGTPIQAISVDFLINKYNIKNVDLMKIDIEGEEAKLLSKNNHWLNSVKNIIIEIHKPYDVIALESDLKPFQFNLKYDKHQILFLNK